MRLKLTLVVLSAVIVPTALYHARTVHATPAHAEEHRCSLASLKGTYAFLRTGVNNVAGGPIAEIGIDLINGDGTRGIIRSTRSTNGVIQDWTNFPPNTGSYTIDSDCTGSFIDANGNKNNIIVLDRGRRFLVLSAATGTIVTSEGTRLEVEE
jgi:hypothetical protein